MRVLLVGAQSQLGRAMQRTVQAGQAGIELIVLNRQQLDITDAAAVRETVERIQPDWVVNAAAYTKVDWAEEEPNQAFATNRDGPAHLAAACSRIRARMVLVSTDYVFDGTQARPYRRDDLPNPINVYGKSKLAGEQVVRETLGEDALVLRTAWVYSLEGPSFLATMLRLMQEKNELRVVEDQIGTPTSADSLAKAVFAALENNVTGIHHWTDAGVASWYDFAVAIGEEALALGLLRRTTPVIPIPSDEYPTRARRPAYSVLDKTDTRQMLGIVLPHWLPHWRSALRDELNRGTRGE